MAKLKGLTKNLMGVANKKSPQILTGVGVAGTISTAFLAVKATPRALELIKEEEEYRDAKLSKVDIVKTVWKCYIPAVGMGAVTIACIIGANNVNSKRNAALAGLYSLTETAFREYQNKVVDTIGQNKELKIHDEIAADRVRDNQPGKNEVLITGKGGVLCLDCVSGRYFKSDIESIRKSVNELNSRLRSENHISLNEFYYELGLSSISIGDDVGFEIAGRELDIRYSSTLTEDSEPCLVLNYRVYPR